MKKIKRYIVLGLLPLLMVSCLKKGLDDLPLYEDAEITDTRFEYRYDDPSKVWDIDKSKQVDFIRLPETNKVIDQDNLTVNITVSAPGATETFPASERDKVSLANITGYFYISTAASIQPLDGAPLLGKTGNFTSPVKYKVTAADGKTSKTWTITVTLVK